MYEIDNRVEQQIRLIEEAMKLANTWSTGVPDWVLRYPCTSAPDFWQWLQFVQLPLRERGALQTHIYLAPQARDYVDPRIQHHTNLMQRLIELDAITPTRHTSQNF